MPIYEFKCIGCDRTIEARVSYHVERKLLYCPICKIHIAHKKVFSGGSNFILKGSGWAKDNYCKKESVSKG